MDFLRENGSSKGLDIQGILQYFAHRLLGKKVKQSAVFKDF